MFKVGDFSQLGQVSVRTLHHYDRRGLLKPARIDDWTGYRFYSAEQLPRLNRILALKDLGSSLGQIGRLLDDGVPAESLRGMLTPKQAEIERQLTEGQTRLARVEARLRRIEHEDEPSPYEVILKRVAPRRISSVRGIAPALDDICRPSAATSTTNSTPRSRSAEHVPNAPAVAQGESSDLISSAV